MGARQSSVILGITTIAFIALVGCGGSKQAAETTTIINQTVMPSSAAASARAGTASASAQPAGAMPAPPIGATQVGSGTKNGTEQTKYTVNGQSPNQVAEYYSNLWSGQGYTIITSSSGADGGLRGGAKTVASKAGTFVGVEAGADAGEPTHFEVCQGAREAGVRDCID
jgi:hypothetical protein